MNARPHIPVVPLRQAAEILGVSVEAARSALRHHGVKSGYPLAAVEWLAANRPGQGTRTDLQETTMQDATATTEIGTWATLGPSSSTVTIQGTVADAVGEFAADYDIDAIITDYRDAINAAMPEGVSLHGQDYIVGPYRREGWTDEELAEVREAIASVDLWEIVGRHDETTAQHTATLRDTDMAQWIADMPQLAGNGHRVEVDGATVTLSGRALEVLAGLDSDCDGHYDGTGLWVGGDRYEVRPA